MEDLATNSEAIIGGAGLLFLGALALVGRTIKALASSSVGKQMVRGLVEDLDEERKPKPDTDSALLVQAIATATAQATKAELRPEIDDLRTQISAVRTEQGAADERETERSRRVDRIELATEGRLARIEGHLGIGGRHDESTSEDAPTSGARRR